ncbi:MAG: ROK family protein, partial [Pedobacter sp.]|nr:ROK family protein [Chitinophagaceae bacterium]
MNNRLAIGIDIGGTRTKIGLVDLTLGRVLKMIISPTETKNSSRFLDNIKNSVDELIGTSIEKQTIAGIGFGVPSFVFENGIVDSTSGFLDFMEDYPLVSLIEQQCQLSCKIDNDARMVALGETLYGRAKNYNRVLVLTLGTGLGLGFVVNKKLENSLPFAHMGGHMSMG